MNRFDSARLSRRDFVASSLGAGVVLALGQQGLAAAAAAKPDATLITRPIPASGERLPVIGLGTNAYGVTDPADLQSRREVLQRMPDLGGTLVDTAYHYGESEAVIGRLVTEIGNRDRLFIASKTPIRGDIVDAAALVEESFKRLQVETIDLMQIHNLHGVDAFMPVLLEMKAAKRIRYVGMSTSDDSQYPAFLEALGRYPVDFLQVDYSVTNRSAAERVLPFAQDKGLAVLINMPLGGRRGAGNVFAQLRDRELPGWAAEADITSWAQFLLKYVVSHPTVTCAIPGTTRATHLVDNQGAARGRLPDADMRKRMEAYWDAI